MEAVGKMMMMVMMMIMMRYMLWSLSFVVSSFAILRMRLASSITDKHSTCQPHHNHSS